MAYKSNSAWRQSLKPASFRNVQFLVDISAQGGGRRGVLHEYPKRDTPYWEDMGRRARHHPVQGYLIGSNYLPQRDQLIAALDAAGNGMLVHPLLGAMVVGCDHWTCQESRERGGYCTFEMAFSEAGSPANASALTDTQAQTQIAANSADQTAVSTFATITQPPPTTSAPPENAAPPQLPPVDAPPQDAAFGGPPSSTVTTPGNTPGEPPSVVNPPFGGT
jgi:prophage DNA circulation protein